MTTFKFVCLCAGLSGLAGCASTEGAPISTASAKAPTNSIRRESSVKASKADVVADAIAAKEDACEKWQIGWHVKPDDHQGMTQPQWQEWGHQCTNQ